MKTVIDILLVLCALAIYIFVLKRKQKKEIEENGNEMEESQLASKPRKIVVKGINSMDEFKEMLDLDHDEETYGKYQLEVDGNNANIILPDGMGFKAIVELMTSLYVDIEETHVENPAERIKCFYPIGKITFGDNVIANTDVVIYPVGNPDDLTVNFCTRDNKIYRYQWATETIKEITPK